MNLLLFTGLYLSLGFVASMVTSFLILRHFPKKEVKFAFYLSIIVFGFVIFFIILIPFDVVVTEYNYQNNYKSNNFLTFLPYYYLSFGYFSQIVGDILCPILILNNTSAFYEFFPKIKNIAKRFVTEETIHLKALVLLAGSFPVIRYMLKNNSTKFEVLKTILNYLKFLPYLKSLYYIGYCCQEFVYKYIRRKVKNREFYTIWKLGKIAKYYFREKDVIQLKYRKIKSKYKKIKDRLPKEFKDAYNKLKNMKRECMSNHVLVHKSNMKRVKEIAEKNQDTINSDKKLEVIKDYDPNIKEKLTENRKNNISDILNETTKDEDISKEELIKSNTELYKEYIWDNCNDKNKNFLLEEMTQVKRNLISIQRKSFLMNRKGIKLLLDNDEEPNCAIPLGIAIFYIILFLFEMPWSIYDWFPNEFGYNLLISFISISFYSFIFIYSVIHHKYLSGNYIFGNRKSDSVNFYYFLSYVLSYCDAMFYHSIWVLSKQKKYEKPSVNYSYNSYNSKYSIYSSRKYCLPKYFEVYELPEIPVKGFNIITIINIAFIIISIFIATKFSNLKIKKKQILLFNENADFFYNEKNLYFNYILGCGSMISILDNIIHLDIHDYMTDEDFLLLQRKYRLPAKDKKN